MRNVNLNAIEDVPRKVIASANRHTKSKVVPCHGHRRSEIIFAEGGSLVVETEHNAWSIPTGCGIWIPSKVTHTLYIHAPATLYVAWIDDLGVRRGSAGCEVLSMSFLLRCLLIESADITPSYEEDARDGMLIALLLSEVDRASNVPIAVPLPKSPRLLALCRRFMESPRIDDDPAGWSAALGVSTRTFDRLFQRETGCSFGKWRRQTALAGALLRLSRGETVTTISIDLGYENVSTFSTMVRRMTGLSPVEWRMLGAGRQR